ncbi:hypothetical protein PUMCH_003727 [Australozyma saopauloensis]|uniref:Uncharacterized protein n=1 Tax=Australozyma saopauloensis TaxID=291208 RepID=A0AAX4HDH6_9ASCO|nr:hypothetical protein PUMCH_003727 [[Candida] saopauloensis]
MMWYTGLIVTGTIVCGCLNSLLTKFQDNQCVAHCNNPDPTKHKLFEQPAIQTLQMFIGELAIYLVYYSMYKAPWSKRNEYTSLLDNPNNRNVGFATNLYLAIPSICDLLATTLMNVGLVYTPVSIYQMTRGAVVLFVAILSVLFLQRRIRRLEWLALVFVSLGVAIVGYSGSGKSSGPKNEDPRAVAFGITLVLCAVALQAVQFVVEERILSRSSLTPLKLVYTEGFFGAVILVVSLVILNYVFQATQSPASFKDSPFNLGQSLRETFLLNTVLVTSALIMVCISMFNYCGLSLTNELSATARSTIDNCRTLLVWIIAMVLGWESFKFLQFVGFAVLVFGTLCFNGILQPEEWTWVPAFLKDPDHKNDRLIDVVDEPIDRM